MIRSRSVTQHTAIQHDIADASLADRGLSRIAWTESRMPVLGQIRDRFERERPLEGYCFAACMHMTAETAVLLKTLQAGGATVSACASNPLSTQDDTMAALVKKYGISVFARHGVSVETYYRHINQALDVHPDFVFDDGCDLVNTIHNSRTELLGHLKGGCEETTTGVIRLRQMASANALKFPMVAVNDTNTKHMFDNRYGTGQSSLDAIMRATNVLFAGRIVVVSGFGYCGKGIAQRAAGLGAQVVVTEIDPIKALDALMQGHRVMPSIQAARIGDIFITATGNRGVLNEQHFAVMKDGAILSNAGHFDVEVDVRALTSSAREVRRNVRHSTDEYIMPDGRRLALVAEGRLVNLGAADGHPADVMDMSFADQALTAEWLVKTHESLKPGVHDVPEDIDRLVAELKLATLNVAIDELTADQTLYLSSWAFGS